MSLWDEVKTNMADWYSTAADKTGEMVKVGVRKYDRFGISRDVERQFAELGGFVYNAINEKQENFLEDPTLVAIVERIRNLEVELARKEEEISSIHSEYRARTEAKAQAETVQEDAEAEPVEAEPMSAAEVDFEVAAEVYPEVEPEVREKDPAQDEDIKPTE